MNSFFKGKFQDKVLLMFIIPLVLFGSFAVDVYGDTLTHITSISEIGMPEGSIDSHAGYWGSSRLELNYREQSTIDPSTLVSSRNIYSRVKKISSTGKYLLLWQNEQIGSIIRYSLSSDSSLSSWDKGKILFDKTTMTFNEAGFAKQEITKSYTNADAVVLGDGKTILAVASFRAGKVGDYSLLGNKRYALLNKYCGIDLRYSTDGGVTWSDIQRVYTGYNWEPSFHVVDDNTVQVYFSQVAVAMEHTGIEHSTGVAMFTLTKNGTGWVSDSVPVNGRSFSKTTTSF